MTQSQKEKKNSENERIIIAKEIETFFYANLLKGFSILLPDNWNDNTGETFFKWKEQISIGIDNLCKKYGSDDYFKREIIKNLKKLNELMQDHVNMAFDVRMTYSKSRPHKLFSYITDARDFWSALISDLEQGKIISQKPLHDDTGRKILSYNCKNISKNELETLFRNIKEVLFTEKTTSQKFISIFSGKKIKNTIQVKSTRLLAYFLQQLHFRKFIPDNWQSIAERSKMFKSKTGKNINANDLARAISDFEKKNPTYHEFIDDALASIKKVS